MVVEVRGGAGQRLGKTDETRGFARMTYQVLCRNQIAEMNAVRFVCLGGN